MTLSAARMIIILIY